MRYFSYNEWTEEGGIIETWSEDDIRSKYYPYWLSRMNEKFGEQHVQDNYTFEHCLEDWVTINWAWPSVIE